MRNEIPRILAVVVAAIFVMGCQQQRQTAEAPNEKQARLLAAQSADLQRQLAARQDEIGALRQKHARELRQRDEELAQCKARIELLQKDVEKGIADRVSGVAATLMEENAKLRKEIEGLKAQIRDLKKQSEPQGRS